MNLSSKLPVISLLAVVSFVVSCDKDEKDDATSSPTKTQLLTAHSWRMTDFIVDGVSEWDPTDSCANDNLYTFSTDGTFVEDEGPTKCNSSDPQIADISTWMFANNQTILVIGAGTPGEASAEIIQLDGSNLRLREEYIDPVSTDTTIYETVLVK